MACFPLLPPLHKRNPVCELSSPASRPCPGAEPCEWPPLAPIGWSLQNGCLSTWRKCERGLGAWFFQSRLCVFWVALLFHVCSFIRPFSTPPCTYRPRSSASSLFSLCLFKARGRNGFVFLTSCTGAAIKGCQRTGCLLQLVYLKNQWQY